MFPFTCSLTNSSQLSIRPSEIFEILSSHPNWPRVRCVVNPTRTGFIPSSYVTQASEREGELFRSQHYYPQDEQLQSNHNEINQQVNNLHSSTYSMTGRVLFDFLSSNPFQLTIHKGELLKIFVKSPVKENEQGLKHEKHSSWLVARNSNGTKGLVPANYVQLIE